MLVQAPSNQSTPDNHSHISRLPLEETEDDATRLSLEFALRLQQEENERIEQHMSMMSASPSEPNDEELESIALAIRLQQEEDDAMLRAALGVDGDQGGPASPSNYRYEDLLRLSDTVGTVSRAASEAARKSLASLTVANARKDATICLGEQCSICRMEFDDAEELRVLPCKHAEHADCMDQWLGVSKCCPLCQKEVEP